MKANMMLLAMGMVSWATMAYAGEPKVAKGEGILIEFLNGVEKSNANAQREKIVMVIEELGRVGGIGAVRTLTAWLDFHINEYGVVANGEIAPPEDQYPAVKSILQIASGRKEEAVEIILLSIVSEKRSETFESNAVYLLIKILGTPEIAKKRLLEAAATKEAQGKTLRTLGERIPGPLEKSE